MIFFKNVVILKGFSEMKLKLTYCSAWGYEEKAARLAEQLLVCYKKSITEFTLIPSDGGRYEIEVNDELLFSKKEEGRYPSFAEIREKIDGR